MKRITYHLAILLTIFSAGQAFSQACAVNIIPSTTVACSGDNVTLNAYVNGPDLQLMASNTAGNNHRGNMFDIVATNDVTILWFDASPMGNTNIEIYYKVGTWNGFANTPSAWTLIGSAPVPYTGGFSFVNVPVNVTIPAGQTYAFYVTSNNTGVSLNYSNGSGVGNVYSSDANITFLEGGGMEYPFTAGTGAVYQPRVWNGNIHYSLANQPGVTYQWGTMETTQNINPTVNSTTQFTVAATHPGCGSVTPDTLNLIVSIPTVDAGSDQAVCLGDQVLLSGTGAQSYTWDNGVTDGVAFIPGATSPYIVTGTDSAGCVDNDTVSITVNSLPNVTIGPDYAICMGDVTTLTATGAPTLSWTNGVTNGVAFYPTSNDTYIVTGTDVNGCVDKDTIDITVNPVPYVLAGSDQEICAGIEYTLSGSGAGSIGYTWNHGVTDGVPFLPITANYVVTGTNVYGCTASDTMHFFVQNVDANIVHISNTLLTSAPAGATIQWVTCPGYTPIPGATIFGFSPTTEGSYAVIITDPALGCSDTSACELVTFAGMEEELESQVSVYPIPTNGKITIASTGNAIKRVELVDMLGKVLQSAEPNADLIEIDLTEYSAGTFFVRVFRDGHTAVKKIIKQ